MSAKSAAVDVAFAVHEDPWRGVKFTNWHIDRAGAAFEGEEVTIVGEKVVG